MLPNAVVGWSTSWLEYKLAGVLTRYQTESDMAKITDPAVFEAVAHKSPRVQGAYTKDATFENATPDAKEAKS